MRSPLVGSFFWYFDLTLSQGIFVSSLLYITSGPAKNLISLQKKNLSIVLPKNSKTLDPAFINSIINNDKGTFLQFLNSSVFLSVYAARFTFSAACIHVLCLCIFLGIRP